MPTPISNYGIAPLTDANGLGFYVFGGRDGNASIITTVQAYYPASNTTAVISTDPWPGTTPSGCVSLPAMGVAVVGNKAFVLGGSSFAANGCVDDNSKQTWIFDPMAPAGKRWTQGPDLNLARGYITPAVLGTTIYAIGGDINIGGTPTPQKIVESSVGGTSPWKGVADLPEPCDESQAFGWTTGPFANTVILAGCGQWPNALADVLQYNAGSNSWAIVSHLNDARRNQAGARLGTSGRSSMYVLGGYNSNGGAVLQSSEIGPGTAVPDAQQQGPRLPRSGGAVPNN
jgi:hypothetical protein